MNSYVSDPCLVYKKMAQTVTIVSAIMVPSSNPHLDTFFLANLADLHVASIFAISTYIKPNI